MMKPCSHRSARTLPSAIRETKIRNMNRNIWKDGVMGGVVGDALGCPVQFETREEIATHPIAVIACGLAGLYYGLRGLY